MVKEYFKNLENKGVLIFLERSENNNWLREKIKKISPLVYFW